MQIRYVNLSFTITFTQLLLSTLDFIVCSSLEFIFHANERDILLREVMHSLHRVCLATFGSLGAGSCPCYATRFGEESTLFSRNRAAAPWWVAGKLLMIKVNAQSEETRFSSSPSFLLLFFPSSSLFPWVARGARTGAVRRRDTCRCIVAATMNDGHSSPPWLYRCCRLPTYVYYTNSHLQQRPQYAVARS